MDDQSPELSITFPPRAGLISYDASFLVKGTASDNVEVGGVSVNGVEATSTDDFKTWNAQITLTEKSINEISVEVRDVAGNVGQASTSVVTTADFESRQCEISTFDQKNNIAFAAFYERLGIWSFDEGDFQLRDIGIDMRKLVFDNSRSILYALDYDKDVYRIDVTSGNYDLVSKEGANGVSFQDGGFDLVVDEETGFIYAYTDIDAKVFSIDPESGQRKIISGAGVGAGSALPYSALLEFDQGRLFYLDGSFRAADLVFEIDLETGDRTRLAMSQSEGDGEFTFFPHGFAVDALAQKAFVYSNFSDFIEVDLNSGERSMLSDGYNWRSENILVDSGVDDGIFLDRDQSRLIVSNCRSGDYFAIDIATGGRSKLTPDRLGTGADLEFLSGILFSPINDAIYTVTGAAQNGAIVRVNKQSGDREVISATTIGGGVDIPVNEGFAISANGATLYGGGQGRFYKVDVATGASEFFSHAKDGNGVDIGWGMDFDLDEEAGRVMVVDYLNNSVVAVDILTGEKSILSSSEVGDGPDIVEPKAIVVNKDTRAIYITGDELILEVDPETGSRSVLVDTSQTADFSAAWVSNMIHDVKNNRLVAPLNGGAYELVEIDLETKTLVQHELRGIPYRPHALAHDPEAGFFYGSDIGDAFISVIDPGLNAAAVISR
ncbi:hypothetical protein HXX02_09995 [Microbulbifer elongatus]|uniref:Uncharacterized protein n=1 Tax=Microbulbifer elongatus TaxID=86173 RepID=A0ABT1P0Y2_9GAMM|nr:hypothetical protein [Microbulbifer elongatus]MCQ3829779.1 hypothetical protein [Microbulbifer elongatus]